MAYYFIFPEKDSTVYSHPDRDTLNTGNDEILELVKEKGVNNQYYYPSRIFIKFKDSDIKQALSLSNNITSSLQLFSTEHKNLAANQSVEVFPLSKDWDEGTGRFSNLPISSNGCSWLYTDNSISKNEWLTSNFFQPLASINYDIDSENIGNQSPPVKQPITTGSISRFFSITKGGGEWQTGLSRWGKSGHNSGSNFNCSQSFSNADILDLNIDVTSLVKEFSASLFNPKIYSVPTVRLFFKTNAGSSGDSFKHSHHLVLVSTDGTTKTYIGSLSNTEADQAGQLDSYGRIKIVTGAAGGDDVKAQALISAINGPTGHNGKLIATGVTQSGLGAGVQITQAEWNSEVDPAAFPVIIGPSIPIDPHAFTFYMHQYENHKVLGVPNYGFVIKNIDNVEENISGSNGQLQYFSSDTHTIYPPRLAFKWDDSVHTFNSSAKLSGELAVSLYGNKKEYNQNDVAKIKLHVRDKYPTRQFITSSNYLDTGYFTTSSYYSIRDAHTEEIIVPFDDYNTKLSADSDGMYFNLYMNGLQPERYYRILFKHINNDGTQIYDDNYHFKVVR
tara:strand:+ start:1724 stop:3403 length:1680 start_codon:yes stop_codon:yes gene_type:complete